MSLGDYKEAIKNIIDSTDNELLLKHWKQQIEWDVENQGSFEFSDEEWNMVQEGIEEYKKGEIISMQDFISKRK